MSGADGRQLPSETLNDKPSRDETPVVVASSSGNNTQRNSRPREQSNGQHIVIKKADCALRRARNESFSSDGSDRSMSPPTPPP